MIVQYDESILTYIASIRDYFGLKSSFAPNKDLSERIRKEKPERIYLILIDAMGANLIKRKLPAESFLNRNMLSADDDRCDDGDPQRKGSERERMDRLVRIPERS